MRRCLFSRPTVTLVRLHTQNLLSSRLRAERIALLRMTKIATLALHPPFQVTMVQSCIRRNQQFTPSPITQAFSFPKSSMRPVCQKRADDNKSIDEAINEAANDSTHSVPPSAEIQLTQANEHPLMQAIEVCKQSVHTTAKALSTAGHAVAKAAKTTGHAIRTAATAVKTAWHTFVNFKAVQLIIKFFKKAYALWKKRMKFSYAFYTIVFFLLTSAEVIFLQWGMYSEPEYEKGTEIDETTKVLQSVGGQVTRFISQMWLEQKNVCLVSFMGLALIYLALIFVTNRFWIATLVFGVALTAFGVANSIKVQLRNEPIIPADLTFISGGDTGSIMSFVPKSSQAFVNGAITFVIWFAIIIFALFVLDGRRRFIHCSWRRPYCQHQKHCWQCLPHTRSNTQRCATEHLCHRLRHTWLRYLQMG